MTEQRPQNSQLNALDAERALFAFKASRNKQELETFISLYPKQLVLIQQAREAMKRMEFDVDLAFIQACRAKIAQAQLDAVIFELSKINTDPIIRDEITFHSATWTMLNRDQRKGILKLEDYQYGIATLTNKIQMLLIELEKPLLRG